MATTKMAEYYEAILSDLRVERQRAVGQLEMVQIICDEQKEEIEMLRKEYIDVLDTNETLEQTVMELKDKLEMKGNENRCLRNETLCDVEEKLLLENKQLKEQISEMKNKYENLVTQLPTRDSYNGKNLDIFSSNEDSFLPLEPDQMHQLLQQMTNQHEMELKTLRAENDELITLLENQCEMAISDKEEVSEMYLAEIERLDLALTEAVTRLAEEGIKADDFREPSQEDDHKLADEPQLADEGIKVDDFRQPSQEDEHKLADEPQQSKIDTLPPENTHNGDAVEMPLKSDESVQSYTLGSAEARETEDYSIYLLDLSDVDTKENPFRV